MDCLALSAGLLAILLAGCAPEVPDAATPKVLNSTVYVKVANSTFAVPVGEIDDITPQGDCNCKYYSPRDEDVGARDAERLARDAARKSAPLRAGHIQIAPGVSFERVGANATCDATSASWQCRAASRGVKHDLPYRFTISDDRYLKQFKAHWANGSNETVFDQIVALSPISNEPKVACDKIASLCTAAILLSPHVVAIWRVSVKDSRSETAAAVAGRQGRAIRAMANGS